MAQPAVLVDADGKPIYGEVSDKEILAISIATPKP